MNLLEELEPRREESYRRFQLKLVPDLAPERALGVRMPALRKLARHWAVREPDEARAFTRQLPHRYFEEDLVHGFLIEGEKSPEGALALTEEFLPWIDNWWICDGFNPKALLRCGGFPERLKSWLAASHPYTVRFAIVFLLRHYWDERFDSSLIESVLKANREHYYVQMALAWWLAEGMSRRFDLCVSCLHRPEIKGFVAKRALQKALESYKLTAEQKEELRRLRPNLGEKGA